MNDGALYRKLVDLYAGGELPAELEEEMEWASIADPDLARDMVSLRRTVEALRAAPIPAYGEESMQRVLMKLYTRGLDLQPRAPEPTHLQYHLPISG
ncbi:MAG: hypothetical protein KIS66_01045 [Fimbriimonadaceae bacterium]|nr:hypothetical protein [Fimbriimonadaceae bacterium]